MKLTWSKLLLLKHECLVFQFVEFWINHHKVNGLQLAPGRVGPIKEGHRWTVDGVRCQGVGTAEMQP